MRAASIAAWKQSAGVLAATTGSGDSPWPAVQAISRSAASVLVGMPVEGPARWMSTTDQRQLHRHGQPDRLGLEVHAGPAGGGHREPAAEGGAERHVGGGDLVLGLDRVDAELAVARQRVQQLGRRA
jgi:hypothetical protein